MEIFLGLSMLLNVILMFLVMHFKNAADSYSEMALAGIVALHQKVISCRCK